MTIRIVVADDHPIMRVGTTVMLQQDPNLIVVGEAGDGDQAIMICSELHPDLLLLDLRLPKKDGLMVTQALLNGPGAPRILMLSAFSDTAFVRAALDAGASGYVLKSVTGADLVRAIWRVALGERVLLGVDDNVGSPHKSLSARELVVLRYVAEGLSTKEIAHILNSSPRTIETYLSRIFQKLNATSRMQAVMIARRNELLPAV